MNMVIIKYVFNARYWNNCTCISFIIQDTVISTFSEVSAWIIIETCLLSKKLLILSATLLNRYSDIIYSEKGRGLKLIQATLYNCPGIGGQTPASYQYFIFILHLWCCYEGWAHYYLVVSRQYYITLAHHFQYFLVLGYAQHSWKIRWAPQMWVSPEVTCNFTSISCFALNVYEAPCQTKKGLPIISFK